MVSMRDLLGAEKFVKYVSHDPGYKKQNKTRFTIMNHHVGVIYGATKQTISTHPK